MEERYEERYSEQLSRNMGHAMFGYAGKIRLICVDSIDEEYMRDAPV